MRAMLATMLAVAAASPLAAQSLPQYRIVAEEKSDQNRTVDVRIDRRIEETEVSAIANAIASRETKPYARTTINFMLSTARPGEPPWANATLVREVRVKIPGLRLDEERAFTAEAVIDRRDVIGSWLTSTPATPGRLTIYREGRRTIAEWRMRTGVKTQDEVTETRVTAGRRFDLKSGASDDHFLVLANGDLEIRAKGTLIAQAERIRATAADVQAVAAASGKPARPGSEAWPPSPFPAAGKTAAEQSEITPGVTAEPVKPVKSAVAPKSPQQQRKPAATAGGSPKIDLSIYLQPQT